MTRIFENVYTYHFDWKQIATAFWKKYPNKHSKHVLSEDVIDRTIDKNNHLITRRIFVKTNSCPKWVERFLPSRKVHVLEDSYVDPERQTLTTVTRNLGMTNLMTLEETCVYKPHPENSLWTIVERKAVIDSKLYGIKGRALKAFAYERYKYNVKKANSGFQAVLKSMWHINN